MEWLLVAAIPGAIWLVIRVFASSVDRGHKAVQRGIENEEPSVEPDPWETGFFVTENDPE